ncbi:LysM peptidoglycan-binding domain-containing protein [Oceanobacillus chungangensis]|uniref:LysM peptidoglycan-binding domain-containing protein n=1 Tax=Oceanobacillus chungangensis TaxID=1229152 RepID=UPI003CCC6E5D
MLAQRFHTTTEEIIAVNPRVNPYYLSIGQQISIPISKQAYRPMQEKHCISQAEVDYRNDLRSLWEEHVAWTRMAIISLVFKLPDVDFVIARLLKNATDMGNMIRRLYGDVAAETYASLIKGHLLIAADLVKAALAGDQQAVMAADKRWHENADEIAVFLNSINRFLTEKAVREMFYHHLDLTKQEAVAMINMDYQKDIDVYDKIEKQAREMADAISDAMVKGYPSMF